VKLNGKVALITGAASGIGHAIAKRYVEADGRVVDHSRADARSGPARDPVKKIPPRLSELINI
jgi:3-hydroxybutyrate dehydrogenase